MGCIFITMALIYQSAIGINFSIYTTFDISGYSTVLFYLSKPSGTKLTKTPTIVNAVTGELSYESISGDLDEVGEYSIQVVVTYPDGDTIKGEIDNFVVYTPL